MTLAIEGIPTEQPGRTVAELSPQLLNFMQGYLDQKEIEFASEPSLLKGGFHTTALRFRLKGAAPPFDHDLVLRVYPQNDTSLIPFREAAFQNGLAEQGFPAPRYQLMDGRHPV